MSTGAVRKSVKHRFLVFGSLTIVMFFIYSCINQTFMGITGDNTSSIAELVRISNSNSPVTFDTDLGDMTALSELPGSISSTGGIIESDIKLTMIDDQFSSVYKKRMIAGTFPDTDATEQGEPYAVISDSLSIKLFKTVDTVGNEVNIFNKKYKVLGVYYSQKSTFWSLFGDGFERVYIPYTSVENSIEKPVDMIAVNLKEEKTLDDVKEYLKEKFGDRFYNYRIFDFKDKSLALSQFNNVILCGVGIMSIIYILMFMTKILHKLWGLIKRRENDYYFLKSLRVELKTITIGIAMTAAGCMVILYLVGLIKFKLYIPENYIPYDNIFDLNFYAEHMLADIRAVNTTLNYTYSYLQYIYQNVMKFNIFFNTLIMVIFISTMSFFRLLKLGEVTLTNILKQILLVLITGTLAGVVICTALGLEMMIPIKALTVIFCYFTASALTSSTEQIFHSNRPSDCSDTP